MRPLPSIIRDDLDGQTKADLDGLFEDYQQESRLVNVTQKVDFAAFHLESRCHLKCIHCFARDDYWDQTNYKETRNVVRLLNRIALLFDRVQFTGGEIFLRRDPLTKKNDLSVLVEEANRRGLESIIQTTGMYYDEAAFSAMRRHGSNWVSLSLDGGTEEVNSRIRGRADAYSDVLEVIPKLKALGYRVKVGTCLTSANLDIDDLVQLGHTLAELEVDNWKLMQFFAYEIGRASNDNQWLSIAIDSFDEAAETIRQRLQGKIQITAHSNRHHFSSPCVHVYPDGKLAVQEGHSEVTIGNLLDNSVEEILNAFRQHNVYVNVGANGRKTYLRDNKNEWLEKLG